MSKRKTREDIPNDFEDFIHEKILIRKAFEKKEEWKMSKFLLDNKIVKIKTDGKFKNRTTEEEIHFFIEMVKILVKRIIPFRTLDQGIICEIRMAKILIENGITDFTYSKRFKTKIIDVTKENIGTETPDYAPLCPVLRENSREVDFFLQDKIKIPLCSEATQALEIKSGKRLTASDWLQKKELRDCDDKINTFIVLWQFLDFWEKNGFLELNVTDEDAFCQKLFLPKSFHKNKIPTSNSSLLKIQHILEKNELDFYFSEEKNWDNVVFLERPTKIFWSSEPVKAIIVNDNEITTRDYFLKRFLSFQGYGAFLSLPQHRAFWKECGFIRQYNSKK